MRLRPSLLLPLALLAAAPARAQEAPARPLVVMNLAAHPDDEDGATLAYYRGHEDAVAYSVIYTRGEGGQNEIGPELYERLGAIRTAETEAAARILGTQVWWLNFYDFGFTKWAREAFAEWSRPRTGFWDTDAPVAGEAAGRDAVTARLVHLIRRLKPDVIFTNHDTLTVGPRAAHGHHQAVGLSAWDAFALAADPAYHPEQLAEPGVALWQPQRLFVRTRTPGAADVAVPIAVDCGGGETCADRAVRAAVLHRSQGFDKLAPRFFRRDTSYFTLYRAAAGAPPLPAGAADLAAGLPPNPHTADLPASYLLDAGRLPALPGGVRTRYAVAFPGQRIRLRWAPDSTGAAGTLTVRTTHHDAAVALDAAAGAGSFSLPLDVPTTLPASRRQYDRSLSSPPVSYTLEGADGVTRGGYMDVQIAPAAIVDLPPGPVRLVRGENQIPVAVFVYSPTAPALRLTLRIERPGADAPLYAATRELQPGPQTAVFSFGLGAAIPPGPARVVVEAVADTTGVLAQPYVVTRPAALLPEVRVAEGLRVGLVRSYDDTTERALRAMGAEVVPLDSTALGAGRFDGLHTIVLDIRAYLARPDLRRFNDRLLDWVREGGHLVVGYQKTFEWNPGAPDPTQPEGSGATNPPFAPYPLVLGRDRVVREDAPVTLLDPTHPLFHTPNAITDADWEGWVQERGLYFPETYDGRYRELLAMGDPGEAPLRGGLLLAEVGAGTYLYSPLVWYRQLEALNPGAWRLFANLVSLPLARSGAVEAD